MSQNIRSIPNFKALLIFVIGLLLIFPNTTSARDEGVNTRLQGVNLMAGSQLLVEDNKYFHMEIHDPSINPSDPWTKQFVNTDVLNKITFGIDESKTADLGADFFYVINFDVELWRYENGNWQPFTQTGLELKVDYNASYGSNLDRDIISFQNVHKSVVTINSIVDASGASISASNLANGSLYLENAVEVNRYYYFDPSFVPNINSFLQEKSVDNHLSVYWSFVREAEWYDLEWTFVDYYAGNTNSDWQYNFDDQATRVRVNETKYELPIVFDEGYILFRYRPVYASPLDGGLPLEGRWSTYVNGANGLVLNYAINAVHTISPTASASIASESKPHETTMNWQYSAVYAEDSRSSYALSYSDGLSKVRQQIAALPTIDKTAVTSAIYDYTGRPTMRILPVPMDDKELHYFHGLNQVNNGGTNEPLHADHFDDDDTYLDDLGAETECNISFPGLSVGNSLGAARYFSDQNSDKEGMQAYVPTSQEAYGSDNAYPFTLVQYMPDHTGRVKRKAGVGANLRLGSGHENRTYYDQPLPGELAFFFKANDIGDINSYRRVINKDPNGQVTFQYLNNFDKVVISSLSPQNPDAYLPANDEPLGNGLSDLLEYVTDDSPLTVSLTRFVEKGEKVFFRYYLDPVAYEDQCITATNVCYDCLYDLELNFSYVDECGDNSSIVAEVPSGSINVPFSTSVGDPLYYNTLCEAPSAHLYEYPVTAKANNTFTNQIVFPENGYLTITKTLRIKPAAADEYSDLYIKELEKAKGNGTLSSGCDFKTKEDWICEQLTGMADEIEDCQSYSCEDAFLNDAVSTYGDEYAQYVENACPGDTTGGGKGGEPGGEGCRVDDFKTFMQNNYGTEYSQYINECDSADFYALNPCKSIQEAMKADFFPSGQYAQYDVVTSGGVVTYSTTDNTSIFHSNPVLPIKRYTTISYDPTTYPIINGAPKNPATMGMGEFILNFNPLWADQLYKKHPEYCYVQFCEENPTYFGYEAQMLQEDDYQRALNKGFFTPQNNSNCPGPTTVPSGGSAKDPYNLNNSGYMTNMGIIGIPGGTNVCVWEAALQAVHTPSIVTSFGSDPCVEDREWIAFRSLYLMGRKALLDQQFFSGGYNCYYTNYELNSPFDQKIQRITFYDFNSMNLGNLNNLLPNQWAYATGTSGATPANMGLCDVCDDYALMWKSKIVGCSSSSATLDNAVEAIRQLCQYQCSQTDGNGYDGFQVNNLGATSLHTNNFLPITPKGLYSAPTGLAYINSGITPFYAENVDDILRQYFSTAWRDMDCNAFLINNPGPYGQNDNVKYLDDCGCSSISDNETNYNALEMAGTLPSGVNTEAQLFKYKYGYHLADYKDLKCKCNALSGTALLAERIPFPEQLTCDVCIACDDMQTVTANFISYFGLSTLNDWTDPITFPKAFTNFANVTLTEALGSSANGDLKLSFEDYASLMNDCEAYCANQVIGGDNLTEYAYELQELLNDLIDHSMLDASSPIPLPKYFDFYRNNLYHCTFSGEEEVTTETAITQTGSTYLAKLELRDNTACTGLSCNCSFEAKDIRLQCSTCPSGVNLANIDHFDYIAADFTGTVSSGEHYEFRISAIMNDGSTVVFDECYVHKGGSSSTKRYPIYSSITNALPAYCSGSGSYTGFMPQICYPGIKYKERDACTDDIINRAISAGEQLYEETTEDLKEIFRNNYLAFCEGSSSTLDEVFELKHNVNNAYVMLYKYDHLGNLAETIPPEGVDLSGGKDHLMQTTYQFNSRNLPVQQTVPDHGYQDVNNNNEWVDGASRFAYNTKTQIVLSQNEEQRKGKDIGGTVYQGYSYSLYDGLGRVMESGLIYGVYNNGSNDVNLVDESKTPEAQDILNSSIFPNIVTSSNYSSSWILQERIEVTRTRYDLSLGITIESQFDGGQENLLNRIASVSYNEVYNSDLEIYNSAIHYSYDEMGNVDKLINDYPLLNNTDNRFKTIDYTFDLVSGNVKEVAYQKGKQDAFYHRYLYDESNRIREAFTSSDYLHWDRDVDYKYYDHGPLGRSETGDLKVQGEDMVYTLQGWLKVKNAADMEAHRDGGKDGHVGNKYFDLENNLHTHFAEDAASLGLYYNTLDYQSIKDFSSMPDQFLLPEVTLSTYFTSSFKPLYNGNIGGRLHQTRKASGAKNNLWATRYRYDQLNRLKEANYHYGSALMGQTNNYSESQFISTQDYLSTYSYDLNGNIKSLQRNGYAAEALDMDQFTYFYPDKWDPNYNNGAGKFRRVNNQLRGVTDVISYTSNYDVDVDDDGQAYTQDIANVTNDNFIYDHIGNLVQNKSECIANIEWTNARKVKKITRDPSLIVAAGEGKPDLEFEYDPMGNRIRKTVKPRLADGTLQNELYWKHTYYQRDAQGNVMATYKSEMTKDDEIHGSFCYDIPTHNYYNPAYTNKWYVRFNLVNNTTHTTSPVIINGSANAPLFQALANEINSLGVQDLSAQVIGGCLHIFSYCASVYSPSTAMIYYEYEDTDGGVLQNEPFFVELQCKFKREQFKLNDHHLYASSRVGVEGRDKPLYDRYFNYSSIDPQTQALVGKAYIGENHPTFTEYPCKPFSGYCLLDISNGGNTSLPYVDLGDGVNIFEGETWPGGNATDFRTWLATIFIPAHHNQGLDLVFSIQDLTDRQIKIGRLGVSNQNGELPVIDDSGSGIKLENFTSTSDPESLSFTEGYSAWEVCEGARLAGNKKYELVDHLNNVQTVVSDRKIVSRGNTIYTDYFDTQSSGWNWQSNYSIDNGRAKIKTFGQFNQFRKNFDVDPNSIYSLKFDIEKGGAFVNNMMALVYDLDNGGQLNARYVLNDGVYETHFMTPNTTRVRVVFQRNSPTNAGLETFYVNSMQLSKNEKVYGGEFTSPLGSDWIFHEVSPTIGNNGRLYVQATVPGHGMQKQFFGLDDQKTYKIRCALNPYQISQMNIKVYSGGSTSSDLVLNEDFVTVFGSHREWNFQAASGFDWATVKITRVTPGYNQKLFILEEFVITEGENSSEPDQFIADIISTNDYYPFGMLKPGELYSSAGYRYGFQGQEQDNELKGSGNSINYKYRIHDPRLGRFFAIDPLSSKYPYYTPYSFSGNKLIHAIELEGLEEFVLKNHHYRNSKGEPFISHISFRHVNKGIRAVNQPGAFIVGDPAERPTRGTVGIDNRNGRIKVDPKNESYIFVRDEFIKNGSSDEIGVATVGWKSRVAFGTNQGRTKEEVAIAIPDHLLTNLDNMIAIVLNDNTATIHVTAQASPAGGDEYNKVLAADRTAATVAYILEYAQDNYGADLSNRIESKSGGVSDKYSDTDNQDHQRDRTVLIKVERAAKEFGE